jgi:2Fe-2S ferredoxin
MPSVQATSRDGTIIDLPAKDGWSLMELLREGGLEEIEAICGGCCSCATCHVHVDESFLPLLPAMGSDEDDLLDMSAHRVPGSRLSCQIPFTEELDGLRLTVAPQD